jgi:UDP-glucose 4-epimerase
MKLSTYVSTGNEDIMKVLIAGGAGFIGSHIAELALSKGYEVVCLDNLSRGHKSNVPKGARLIEADVLSKDIFDILKTEKPDIVCHHAAQINVRTAIENPVYDAEQNILGLLNLMEASRKSGVEKVVFASSGGAIYGEQLYFPADEEHKVQPLSPYGITKLTGEKYLDFYRNIHSMKTVALRYSNVYGPRQDSKGDAGVVAIFATSFIGGQKPVIFGDGEQTRDYVYVKDVARANLLAFDLSVSEGVFNIATGVETSVNELFRLVNEKAGTSIVPSYGDARDGEVSRSSLDASLAGKVLKWTPTVNLNDGLTETVQWFKK